LKFAAGNEASFAFPQHAQCHRGGGAHMVAAGGGGGFAIPLIDRLDDAPKLTDGVRQAVRC
jgi:hypothetical protein